jgi:LmbE family N-acetylglucosaminyl deacetylase
VLLLAASIAGGIPVSLHDTLPGIDHRNASLVVKAIAREAGQASRVITHPDGRWPGARLSYSPNTVYVISPRRIRWRPGST